MTEHRWMRLASTQRASRGWETPRRTQAPGCGGMSVSSLHAKAATRETPPLPTSCGQKRKPGLLRRSAEHAPDPRETPKGQRSEMITVRCPRREYHRVHPAPPTRSASAVPRLLEECREERAWLSGDSTSGARRTHVGNWGFSQWGRDGQCGRSSSKGVSRTRRRLAAVLQGN